MYRITSSAGNLLKAPVIGSILANKNRVYRRLHIVIDTPRTGPAEKGERFIMGVKHHLLRLARIGPNKRHPAVAEANMRHLDRRGRAIDQDNFLAPVGRVASITGQARSTLIPTASISDSVGIPKSVLI